LLKINQYFLILHFSTQLEIIYKRRSIKHTNQFFKLISTICVQNFNDSQNLTFHTTYRISLRSSSIKKPRYPLLKAVIYFNIFLFLLDFISKILKNFLFSNHNFFYIWQFVIFRFYSFFRRINLMNMF